MRTLVCVLALVFAFGGTEPAQALYILTALTLIAATKRLCEGGERLSRG